MMRQIIFSTVPAAHRQKITDYESTILIQNMQSRRRIEYTAGLSATEGAAVWKSAF